MKKNEWSHRLAWAMEHNQPAVLITQLGERGSSPRSSGAKMLVTEDQQYDSLGGGNLEYQATERARALLKEGRNGVFEEFYTLSGQLGQCCGGEVRALFEVFNAGLPELFIFGAGHIAQALVPMISPLPLRLNWIDERDELFTQPIPEGVARLERAPIDVASSLPEQAWVLIMTHDHQLDFDLVRAILTHDRVSYLGMIGSQTKALKFRQRLEARGFTPEQIERLHSPIGLAHLKTKRPSEIAISIAADLIDRYNRLN